MSYISTTLVFDPCQLFADSDDSADSNDALIRGQFDDRFSALGLTSAGALSR